MSKRLEIKFTLKAMEGDRVMVRNYRKPSGEWEPGTVTCVELTIYKDGRCFDTYDVVLDRKSAIRNHWGRQLGGKTLHLYVSAKDIERA